MPTILKIASTGLPNAASADDVLEFISKRRSDFEVEVHHLNPSYLIELTFRDDAASLAVLVKLVFGYLEVELR